MLFKNFIDNPLTWPFLDLLYVLSLEESVQSLMQLLSAKVQTTQNVNNVRSRSASAKVYTINLLCCIYSKDDRSMQIKSDSSKVYTITPNVNKVLDENWSTELYHISFFQIFHVELEYVIFKMNHWANLKGRQF